ncbi:MAG: 3,4-dihydroxy-2-butanone-4-phosphate synthase [Spirochaetales bacterium]|jgi:3,4-dihydroxy 2-butanone 4-phosphate synthase/GTP cyclohydrolase II|nr:3,4-dihydroxy-2-butanone-4-phosphate synthase [Spirochaetales bacterium]
MNRPEKNDYAFASVEEAIEEIRRGKMLIVTDDEDRENEGDFIMAADAVTPEAVNFVTGYGRGLLCQSITRRRARELDLPLMVSRNTSLHETAFTVSVDARQGATTGISAFDRAVTIKALTCASTRPEDLARPGHIFPLIAADGGVLARPGHTEAAADLARLAGFCPSGILCEILDSDGRMARLGRLAEIAAEHGLRILTVQSLIAWRKQKDKNEEPRQTESGARRLAESRLPTHAGDFRILLYENPGNADQPHIALVSEKAFDPHNALVRVHSECLTGEVLLSGRCDCGAQLEQAMLRTAGEGGLVIYLRQEGRGIGLTEKIRAYALQDEGCDTFDANIKLGHGPDERDYAAAAAILKDLGVCGVRLMTNNPAKIDALLAAGIEVRQRVPVEIRPGEANRSYLAAKKARFGHHLNYV